MSMNVILIEDEEAAAQDMMPLLHRRTALFAFRRGLGLHGVFRVSGRGQDAADQERHHPGRPGRHPQPGRHACARG